MGEESSVDSVVYFFQIMQIYEEPKFALVEVDGGFLVEKFDAQKHLCKHGWTFHNVNLFCSMEEVSHLRSEILN